MTVKNEKTQSSTRRNIHSRKQIQQYTYSCVIMAIEAYPSGWDIPFDGTEYSLEKILSAFLYFRSQHFHLWRFIGAMGLIDQMM